MMISSFGCKASAAKSLARLALCTLCALLAGNEAAAAQTYPSKPVHIVVPFAPGGITDILARALAQRLTESMRQQVVVENRPGATGQVGAEAVAKAAPDGYTLLVAADATFVTNPHLYKLANDALSDFAPITGLGISPQALIVNPALPVRTLGDLIELARRKPGEINYGTFGIGSSGHLNIILLGEMTGTSAQGSRLRQHGTAGAISRRADARGKRASRLRGRLLVRVGCAQGNAGGDRQPPQRADPAHFRRPCVPRSISRAELHLLHCERAGGVRRAHSRPNRQNGER